MRPPLITFERIKLTLVLVLYAAMAEYVDPRPFHASPIARLLYLALILEIGRQIWVWRLEVSRQHVQRSADLRSRWDRLKDHFSANQRFRIRRALTILAGLYAFGWLLDSLTTRCSGAVQCAMLFPKLAIENLPAALQVAFYIAIGLLQIFAMFYAMTKVGSFKLVMPGTIAVTFDDVYGQDPAKAKLIEQIDLLETSETVEAAGGYMPKGVLLWGPPGTGKTMMAKAAANASTKPLILVPPGAFASTFVGINFLKVWQLFRTIRRYSMRHDGVIVFIDEIDALGNRGAGVEGSGPPREENVTPCIVDSHAPIEDQLPRRDEIIMMGGQQMGTLQAFLSAMDGMEEPRGLINKILALLGFRPLPPPKYRYLMLGATNLPSVLDPALLRAGRFGRPIHVPYPRFEGRLATFLGYLGKMDNDISDEEAEWAARNLSKGTGASIEDIVNEALLGAFRDGRERIGFRDLMTAMLWKSIGEAEGLQELDEDNWATAIHEAGHAVAAHHLRQDYYRIWVGSIEKRGQTGGVVASTEVAERPFKTRTALLNDIAVSLASRVSEKLVLGEMSSGHVGDGPNATLIAEKMVLLGHGSKLNFLFVHKRDRRDYEAEVETILREGHQLAEDTLGPRREQVEAVAQLMLDEGGTVPGDRIHDLLDDLEAVR